MSATPQERRRHARHLIRPRLYVALNGESSGGILNDVSEGGMSLDILGPRPASNDAQNGHSVLPTNSMTATPEPAKPGATDLPQVSGGQPGSGSLAQEPGASKVGLVSVQPSAQVPESKVLPEYPVIALLKNIQGRVVIGAVIGKDGALQNVRLVGPPSILSAPVLA